MTTDYPDWDEPTGIATAVFNFGAPPTGAGFTGGSLTQQAPGIYTIYTFPANGRIWVASCSYAMGCTGGTGTQQGYCKVFIQSGITLATTEAVLAGTTDADSNGADVPWYGFPVPSGTVIKLDVNNGNAVTGGVNRGSGLVGVSVP